MAIALPSLPLPGTAKMNRPGMPAGLGGRSLLAWKIEGCSFGLDIALFLGQAIPGEL